MTTTIWAEKHRPETLEEFMGQHEFVLIAQQILAGKADLQHYLFHSPEAGTGKTTMARLLAKGLDYQLHEFNASSKKQRGIEFVEEDVAPLARTGNYETIILLDEADRITPMAQDALKGVIEDATCIFILTCNDLSKVSPWLQSRCQVHTFAPMLNAETMQRLATIAAKEGVYITEEQLLRIALAHRGDLRNCIGALQAFASFESAYDADKFTLQIADGGLDCSRFLNLCMKERAVEEAVALTQGMRVKDVLRKTFDFAMASNVKSEMKLHVVEASIICERDLNHGVDEIIVLWNYCRLLGEGVVGFIWT
mgnify:FL=1|tara:strand:- start:2226 stop:3155 length:930 start_codon:yes stop_codon:yes gene_type:complete